MNNRLKSNDDTLTYYSGTNRLKTAYADSFAYNGDGSATFVGGDVSKYNWKNRVEHIDVQDGWVDHDFFYDYDYQGLRVRKEEKRVEEVIFHGKLVFNVRYYYTYYLYGKNGELLCEYDNNGNLKRKYIYLPKTVIQIVQNDTFYIYLDNRGSPVVVTDEEGSVKKQYRYYAFGKLRAQPGSFNTDYSFTGYLKEETGTHYARMRYYEGGIGRFLRPDPIGIRGGINPYVYCNNDPLNFVDPWGLCMVPEMLEDYLPLIIGDGPIDMDCPMRDASIYESEGDIFDVPYNLRTYGPPYGNYIYYLSLDYWSYKGGGIGSSHRWGGGGNRGHSRPKLVVTREVEKIKWEGGGFDIGAATIAPFNPNMMWSIKLDKCLENALLNNPVPSFSAFSVNFIGRYGFTPVGAGFATQSYITATLEAYANHSWACFQCYAKYGIPYYAIEIGDKIIYFIGW